VAVTCNFAARGKVCGGRKDSIGGDGADLREPPEMPLTLQKTEVSEVLVMMAEKASVLPSKTVPELERP